MNGNQPFHFKQLNNNLGIELGSQITSILIFVNLVFPNLKQEVFIFIYENRILYWNLNKVIAAINSKDCNMAIAHGWWKCLKGYKIFSLNDILSVFLLYYEFRCFYVFFYHWIHMQKQCYKWQCKLRYPFKLSILIKIDNPRFLNG